MPDKVCHSMTAHPDERQRDAAICTARFLHATGCVEKAPAFITKKINAFANGARSRALSTEQHYDV
ncbi:hypothetical protein NS311_16220 [Pantoea ananatis]|nr:hypothetical protein NS311_16220 [Pantoea ananatis]